MDRLLGLAGLLPAAAAPKVVFSLSGMAAAVCDELLAVKPPPPQTLGKERGACAKLLQLPNLRLRSV